MWLNLGRLLSHAERRFKTQQVQVGPVPPAPLAHSIGAVLDALTLNGIPSPTFPSKNTAPESQKLNPNSSPKAKKQENNQTLPNKENALPHQAHNLWPTPQHN